MTDDDLISRIIEREGGLVDHPADRGGITKFGITQATLAAHRKGPASEDDVRNLSVTEAREIYRERYIVGPGLHRIASEALRAVLVDYGVHSGPGTAVRALQRTLGVVVDGVIGPDTEQRANLLDGRRLALRVLARRAQHFGEIITKDPKQAVFAHGWMNRLAEQIVEVA